jgi:hypothetical protein
LNTEFYLIWSGVRYGLIITFIMWIIILFQKVNRNIRIGLWAVLIGSLHYGTVMLSELQLPLAMLIVNRRSISPEMSGCHR